MKLIDGLNMLIRDFGKEVLLSDKSCNILNDYGCFIDTPGYKHILKSIIADGYIIRLMALSRWDERINQWASELSYKKGYTENLTKELFVFISTSLGIQCSTIDSLEPVNTELKYVFKPKCPSDEYERLFMLRLDYSNAVAEGKIIGVEIRNIAIKVRQYDVEYDIQHSYGYIYVSLELFRTDKLKRIRKIWVALYGKDDNIIKKFSVGEMRNDDSQLKPCMRSTGVELNEIQKIILFWG